jgi:predicted unusual protein kinase regulating ubiquinone biosynthesis (AarF/ABC1/UbiB family)
LGEAKSDFDEAKFSREISDLVMRHHGANMEEINTGRIVLEITRIAGESNFRMPIEFTMVAKTLLNLDLIVDILDPTFDPKESIRQNALMIMEQRLARTISPGALLRLAVETKSLLEKLPDRINKFLELVSNNQLKLTVDAIDEKPLLEAFQKIANRITLGLVIASLIVGAALLTRVETTFKILGYPGLAIIFFTIAAAMGLWLVISIVLQDRKTQE